MSAAAPDPRLDQLLEEGNDLADELRSQGRNREAVEVLELVRRLAGLGRGPGMTAATGAVHEPYTLRLHRLAGEVERQDAQLRQLINEVRELTGGLRSARDRYRSESSPRLTVVSCDP